MWLNIGLSWKITQISTYNPLKKIRRMRRKRLLMRTFLRIVQRDVFTYSAEPRNELELQNGNIDCQTADEVVSEPGDRHSILTGWNAQLLRCWAVDSGVPVPDFAAGHDLRSFVKSECCPLRPALTPQATQLLSVDKYQIETQRVPAHCERCPTRGFQRYLHWCFLSAKMKELHGTAPSPDLFKIDKLSNG